MFYVEVVQAVIIFESETWVLTPRLEKALEGFHHRVVRRMAGMVPKCQRDVTWVYKPIGAVPAMVGMDNIGVYIDCLHNTVAQYIATRVIMDLCLVEEWKPGLRIYRRWWEHTALYILGNRAGYAT